MPGHYSISQLKLLLVEPSTVQASVISSQLHMLGVGLIEHVTDGNQALQHLQASSFDLVLSALYLDDMSGIDLLTRLRERPEQHDIAFVLVSSETRPQILEPVRQLGACAIIPKPFNTAQLDRALGNTLEYLSEDSSLDQAFVELETLRVLLIDDSRSARNYMRRVLENLGIQHITEAGNGREAVQRLEASRFDFVVTDYNMPEMDGRELVEYIRTQSWQSSLPILMVTSERDSGRLAAIEQAGVSGLCDKPFEPAIVRSLLERVLAQRDAA